MDANKRSYPLSMHLEQTRKMPRLYRRIHRSPSEQSTEKQTGLGRVCLICDCSPAGFMTGDFSYGENGSNMDYCLFLLDLDDEGGDYVPRNPYANFNKYEDGYVPRNPNLCFDSVSLCVSGFCVLGSSLFLFGKETEDVFSYELLTLPLPRGVITLTKDMLEPRPSMKFPKISAGGCQTPDGKMLVLSTKICFGKEGSGTFELFDPQTNRWEQLPDLLPLLSHPYDDDDDDDDYATGIYVHSYSFIDNEPDLLITTSAGNFTMDMRRSDKVWSLRDEFKYPPNMRPRFMLVKDDELCFSDWYAFLLDGRKGIWTYPTLEPRKEPGVDDRSVVMTYDYRSCGRGLAWLPPSSNHFCIAHSHVHHRTKHPYLIIDACSFDSDLFQRKKMEIFGSKWKMDVPGLTVLKRFKFIIGPQKRYEVVNFNPCGLFSIP